MGLSLNHYVITATISLYRPCTALNKPVGTRLVAFLLSQSQKRDLLSTKNWRFVAL